MGAAHFPSHTDRLVLRASLEMCALSTNFLNIEPLAKSGIILILHGNDRACEEDEKDGKEDYRPGEGEIMEGGRQNVSIP